MGSRVLADDSQTILKQAEDKCAEFEAQVKDMHMVQTMATYTEEGKIEAEQTVWTQGEKSRIEMTMDLPKSDGMTVGDSLGTLRTVMINNGTEAWMFSPFGGRQKLTQEEAERNAPARDCWGFFPDNARVTGTETMNGRECYVVDVIEEGVATRLWLDKRNFIPVQGESKDSTGTESYRWVHSDFHQIQGDWEYPYLTEMYDGKDLAATMTVKSLEVNQGLPADLFDPEQVHVPSLSIEDLMKLIPQDEDTGSTK
jgi:outer membrane lipoprotein-sorting protein